MNSFLTIEKKIEKILFKDKGSKFYGYLFPLINEEDVKIILENIKKEHNLARHWCYSYKIGFLQEVKIRVNDDGEPNGTAGLPILNQINSFNLTNVLLIVVRYFGGVKLGVTGLINAYKTTAKLTLESSKIIEKKITQNYIIIGEYDELGFVNKLIKEYNLNIINQNLKETFEIEISVTKENENDFLQKINTNYKLKIY